MLVHVRHCWRSTFPLASVILVDSLIWVVRRAVIESIQAEKTHALQLVQELRTQIEGYESRLEVQTQLTAKQTQVIENLMAESAQVRTGITQLRSELIAFFLPY